MKKFVVLTSLLLMGLLLFTGCHKDKVTDTEDDPVASTLDTQLATTASALYDVTKVGAGAGTTSFGVSGRKYIGTTMTGLGAADDTTGEYTVADPGMPGITCKLKFKSGTEVLYFNMAKVLGLNNDTLQLYPSEDLEATGVKTVTDIPQDSTYAAFFPKYVPAIFCKLSDDAPLAWLTITAPADPLTAQNTMYAAVTDFLTSNFPDSMENTVTGTVGGATISLALTSTMTEKPTDAHPATLTGTGTATLSTGDVLTVVVNVTVGASGPIGGTQTFASTSGITGTLTFHTDKTMTGTVLQNGVSIATISIAANGTGTLTDVVTGAVTTIS
jgi:hypothetical protein